MLNRDLILFFNSAGYGGEHCNGASSANSHVKLNIFSTLSLTYSENNKGTRTNPYGTPVFALINCVKDCSASVTFFYDGDTIENNVVSVLLSYTVQF